MRNRPLVNFVQKLDIDTSVCSQFYFAGGSYEAKVDGWLKGQVLLGIVRPIASWMFLHSDLSNTWT